MLISSFLFACVCYRVYYACSGCGYVCLGTTSRPTLTHQSAFCLPYFRRGTWSVTPDRFTYNLPNIIWVPACGIFMTSPLPHASGVEAICFHTVYNQSSEQFVSPCHENFFIGFRRDLAPMAMPYRLAIHV